MAGLERAVERFSGGLMIVGGTALALMCVHIVLDVLGKFIWNTPITGTLEIVANYYMIAAVFLPLAFTQTRKAHITVELFTYALKPRIVAALDAFIALVWAMAMMVFAWQTSKVAIQKMAANESIVLAFNSVLLWPARWLLPLAALALVAVLLSQSILAFRRAFAMQETPADGSSGAEGRTKR